MSLYIVEDDNGKLLTNNGYFDNTMVYARLYDEPSEPERDVEEFGGHVVELIENPAPVVVSEEEAEIMRMAKTSGHPYGYIYAHTHTAVNEDRLMRAYVNGWTVEKPKRWNIKVPHTKTLIYFKVEDIGDLGVAQTDSEGSWVEFTNAEIEHYGLQDCEKEEVTDDEQ